MNMISTAVKSTFHDKAPSDFPDDTGLRKAAFLLRAGARLTLAELGEMTIDEAFDGPEPDFDALADDSFDGPVEHLTTKNLTERPDIARARTLLAGDVSLDRAWQEMKEHRPTPHTVVEAVLHCVRERGVKALKEPKNIERLTRCDAATRKQIDTRIEALISKGEIST